MHSGGRVRVGGARPEGMRPGGASPGGVRAGCLGVGGTDGAGRPCIVRDGRGRGGVQVVGYRTAEAIRVPAVRVITQVVIDISGRATYGGASYGGASYAIASAADGAAAGDSDRFRRVAIPNVKVISFAAHASSLVAWRSRLTGMRPLPGKRARRSLGPAEVKRYLLDLVFTG
jgi:hypothetical protein